MVDVNVLLLLYIAVYLLFQWINDLLFFLTSMSVHRNLKHVYKSFINVLSTCIVIYDDAMILLYEWIMKKMAFHRME